MKKQVSVGIRVRRSQVSEQEKKETGKNPRGFNRSKEIPNREEIKAGPGFLNC